ncbi:MAG: diguanylate cyclase [Solirubrobacteraceae bacterium]
MTSESSGPSDQTTPLEVLLELAQSAASDPVPEVLRIVAETVRGIAGFGSVVLNVYRPAWDDYQVELVLGSDVTQAELERATTRRGPLEELLADQQPSLPNTYFITAESGFWDALEGTHRTPGFNELRDEDAWRAGDGLLVFLADTTGAPLGFLSMDAPHTGRRPTEIELRLIRAIASHAEQALESARHAELALENERIHSRLLEVSPALAACSSTRRLLETVCDTVVPQLGFERIAAYAVGDSGMLELELTRGWETPVRATLARSLDVGRVEAILDAVPERAGCWLLDAGQLFGPPAAPPRSRCNGRGAQAWNDSCLVVAARSLDGRLRTLLAIEDPVDRLVPSDIRRRVLRLLLDQLSALQSGIDNHELLAHLASHDPLTGVRNRRDLTELIGAHADVALLVCDLDHFKRINDRHGHEVGDHVLARFGELLLKLARESDVPVRLGGEEFCVILPGTDHRGALAAAERLRTQTAEWMRELVPEGVTVSIGVAVTSRGVLDARGLLAAADRGLYAAKHSGRDRSESG